MTDNSGFGPKNLPIPPRRDPSAPRSQPRILYMRPPVSQDIERMMEDAKSALNLGLNSLKQSIATRIAQTPEDPIDAKTLRTLRESIAALKDLKNMEEGSVREIIEGGELEKLTEEQLNELESGLTR